MTEQDRKNVAVITQRASSYDPVIRGEIDYLVGNIDLLDKENEWLKQERESLKVSLSFARKTEGLLDKELAGVKEAGKVFETVAAHMESHISDCRIIYSTKLLLGRGEIVNLQAGDIRRLAEALKGVDSSTTKCQWKVDEDGIYWTGCDGAWEFTTGNVSDNEMKFCPYCGGQLEEVKHGKH